MVSTLASISEDFMAKKRRNAQKFKDQLIKSLREYGLKYKVWDIETGMNRQYGFDIWNGTFSHKTIEKERYIICAAWKDIGDSKVQSVSVLGDKARFKKDPMDDYYVVHKLYEVLMDSDVLIAHFGDKFDLPMFNARAIYHGLPPLPEIKTIDTKFMASKKFRFNSNRLDALAKLFGYEGKTNTQVEMWLGCMLGKVQSVREMLAYNIQDIEVLENVFYELAPYLPAKMNLNLFSEHPDRPACPACGHTHVIKNGYRPNKTTLYHRMLCRNCGHSFLGETVKKEDGKVLRAHYK
jgi:hypothetical protein